MGLKEIFNPDVVSKEERSKERLVYKRQVEKQIKGSKSAFWGWFFLIIGILGILEYFTLFTSHPINILVKIQTWVSIILIIIGVRNIYYYYK